LDKAGRYSEAVASYDKALAIDPNDTDAQENRGIALQKQSQDQKSPYVVTQHPIISQSPNPSSSGNGGNDWFNNFLNSITNLMKSIFPSSSTSDEGSVKHNPPQPSPPVPTIYPNPTITDQPYNPSPTAYPTVRRPINPSPVYTVYPTPMYTIKPVPLYTIKPAPMYTIKPGPMYTPYPKPMYTIKPGPMYTIKPGPMYTMQPIQPYRPMKF
jgi:hypothetical protein